MTRNVVAHWLRHKYILRAYLQCQKIALASVGGERIEDSSARRPQGQTRQSVQEAPQARPPRASGTDVTQRVRNSPVA